MNRSKESPGRAGGLTHDCWDDAEFLLERGVNAEEDLVSHINCGDGGNLDSRFFRPSRSQGIRLLWQLAHHACQPAPMA
ncbi:MAG: hypothetical protein KAU38_16110 [Desulfobacterales bacterium]|nr:hypothetical protein [Desulfobacterales bacterium]